MKIIKYVTIVVGIVLMLMGCSLITSSNKSDHNSLPKEAFASLTEDEQLKIERSTPVMLMNMYFNGINERKPLLSVATLHTDFIADKKSLDEASSNFKGFTVENIIIIPDTEKNNGIDTSKEYHLIVHFEVKENDEKSGWTAGEGQHTYYVKFIKTGEDIWAIREMKTSP